MSVSFGQRPGALDSGRSILNQPQARQAQSAAQQPQVAPAPKKSHKVRNTILGTLAAVAVTAGLLVAGSKVKIKGSTVFEKLANWATKGGAEAGKVKGAVSTGVKALETAGQWIADKGVSAWKTVSGFFSKAKPATTAVVPTP